MKGVLVTVSSAIITNALRHNVLSLVLLHVIVRDRPLLFSSAH